MGKSGRSAVEIPASNSSDSDIDTGRYAPRKTLIGKRIGTEIQSRLMTSNRQPTNRHRKSYRISSSDTDSASDGIVIAHSSSVESECDADDENVEEPQLRRHRRTSPKSRIAPREIPLSNPKSSIWNGREGTNIAVVIPCASNNSRPHLEQASASRLNVASSRRNANSFAPGEGGREILEGRCACPRDVILFLSRGLFGIPLILFLRLLLLSLVEIGFRTPNVIYWRGSPSGALMYSENYILPCKLDPA